MIRLSLVLAVFIAVGGARCAAALQPFRLPWNDASSGITSLQSWQPGVAGDRGWITVTPEGHYAEAGQRIRFLGVNIGAVDCYPSHARAEAHAARLARFGFNAVRFHHMEAQWEKANVIIDYAAGNSRTLSAERLERLHYFVAQLAAHGIYSNINLLVSREFLPGDGLGGDIARLAWKDQHILGFFHDGARALHEEHATKLLTAPNPYRGNRPLGADPAVAFVELMNENGFLQKWYENVLDTLPETYADALRTKWNAWLRNRYGSTAALLAGWGAVDQPLGASALVNGDFAAAANSWSLEHHTTAAATATGGSDFNGRPSLQLSVTAAGTAAWNVQLIQSGLSVAAGKPYTISFWAKAPSATPLSVAVTRTGPDYSGVGAGLNVSLGTTWQQYTLTFQAGTNEPSVRLVFNGFGDRLATVSLADVKFQEGGKIGGLPAGASLEAGTVPMVAHNPTSGSATAGQTRDWISYVLAAEKQYWDGMNRHLKEAIGYRGIVWGTILSNSAPNTQAGLDAMDSHAYWEHPQFAAGHDWDPDLWTIPNTSMVNSSGSNALTGLMRQRVKGYPHNVTEYQHSSPNTYASEGPILSAAYGSLQDWDSLWMFAYNTGELEYVTGHFDHGGHPGKMANNLLAAALFRRGDVSPARRNYTMALTPALEVETARTRGGAWSIADGTHLGVPAALGFESRLSLDIGTAAVGLADAPAAPAGTIVTADTAQLEWNSSVNGKGVVTINTPRTKAVAGFVAGRVFDLGGVVVAPGTTRQDWCTVGLTLLDGVAFDHASGGRGIIVATGDQENTGQLWKDSTRTSVGANWGRAPVLVEVVPATLTLPVPAERVAVWALDGTGQRTATVLVRNQGGRAQFDLGASGSTLWYEFAIAPLAALAPVIRQQPLPQVAASGGPIVLTLDVDGFPAPAIQWFRNGAPVPGATSAELKYSAASAAVAGRYHAVVTNSAGSVTSSAVTVAVDGSFEPSQTRLVNVSTRAEVRLGDDVMIAGLVVKGEREVLIRAVGPRLAQLFDLAGTLRDPFLELHTAGVAAPVKVNDDWSPAEMGDLPGRLGAFSLAGSTKDSATRITLRDGAHSAVVKGAANETGIALVEIYDAGVGDGRIFNLATRALVGTGANSLFVGFVIAGPTPKRVLVRGIGPTLSAFGLTTGVADPKLTLYRMESGAWVVQARNDDWVDADGSSMVATFDRVGAFHLPAMSRDAALDVWLEPGVYSAQIEAKTNPGLGMVEIYEVD